MIQIKIFELSQVKGNVNNFSKHINEFLKDKDVLDVKLSTSADDQEWEITVIVVYKMG